MEESKQLQENEVGYVLVKEIFFQEFLQDKDLTLTEAQELFESIWRKIIEHRPELPTDLNTANAFYIQTIGKNISTHEFLSKLLITKYDYKARRLEQKANEI